MKLALMECGRKLGTYLRKRQKMRREGERRDVFERYIGEIAKAVNAITGEDPRKVFDALLKQAKARTAVADQVLDEDGKVMKDEPLDEDGVIVVPEAIAPLGDGAALAPAAPAPAAGAPATRRSRKGAASPPSAAAAPAAPAPAKAGKRTGPSRPAKVDAARAELRARAAKAAGRTGGRNADGPRLF
jgi:hypothetical protein